MVLLLTESSFEVSLEDLHYRDEALHFFEPLAQLGFTSPGASQPSLSVGEPVPQIVHNILRVVVVVVVFSRRWLLPSGGA